MSTESLRIETRPAVEALHRRLAHDPAAFAVVVAGPSGVGKTTVCRKVLDLEPSAKRLVTTTTRAPRAGEENGLARHFLSDTEFRNQIAQGQFVEFAEVHGKLYGATLDAVEAAMSERGIMLMDVDVQGVATWQQVLESRCVSVFVLPPSMDELRKRLDKRQSETAVNFDLRMANAVREMHDASQCDYVIINDVFSDAVRDLCAIIRAERNRTQRRHQQLLELGIPCTSTL